MLVEYDGYARTILREVNDFGFASYDLVSVPTRLLNPASPPPLVESNIDKRRVRVLKSPAHLASERVLDDGDNWLAMTSRSLARLYASFLAAEDPQRRLDARKAATLMHQVSLVQHILDRDDLRKVLIGDEVGLGKTIEAGLLMRRLIDQDESIRILYLAPARLVRNVVTELRDKLEIDARSWVAGSDVDARLDTDRVVVASIHKAVFGDNLGRVLNSGRWDVLIVDECHHLSDWDPQGGKPNQSFRLVSQLAKQLPSNGRLILMSGTPHQGNEARFKNILRLLSDDGKSYEGAAGRVIFRTKDRVRDWRGLPLFPAREIRKPTVVQLGPDYERWYLRIGLLYDGQNGMRSRAAGWAKGLALQWAASSVQAGMGFLVRLAMRRLGWTLENKSLAVALAALRPYRGGPREEPLAALYQRLAPKVGIDIAEEEMSDDEDAVDDVWRPDSEHLANLLCEGVELIRSNAARAKWDAVRDLIDQANGEKVVLFAQPVETVTLVAGILEQIYGERPAVIIGNQSDGERMAEVDRFQSNDGPQFLVSSRAGGEGLNMQRARRLIHLDVPWNPMDMEQRIGRVHRFGSRKTIIVDTVVAAGSREVDMYRVAREKLALVAQQLDPEQFETLFSRVMSLVPPKELETVLSNVSGTVGLDDPAVRQIGQLVTEGYRSWSTFDEKYRSDAEMIRSSSPGEAHWADVGSFLVKHCGADDNDAATFGSFEFRDSEIVAVEEEVPTIRFEGLTYACGDTGGLSAVGKDGSLVNKLGLNLETVQKVLADQFTPNRRTGIGFVKKPLGLDFIGNDKDPIVMFSFLRQRLEQERGMWSEKGLSFHCFVAESTGEATELDEKRRAALVRACHSVSRIKDGGSIQLRSDLVTLENEMSGSLKRPTDDQMAAGIRYAVWPVAIVALVP